MMHISLLTLYAYFDLNPVELLLLQIVACASIIVMIIMTSACSMRPLGRRDPEADA